MNVIGIPHHDLSSDYVEINFVKVWQSSQTSRLFIIQSGVPGDLLMSLNARASFSLW
jgi:hypothetical protein